MSAPEPSPTTRPSRSRSKGRGVCEGSSFQRVLVAKSVSKIAASVASSSSHPPAIITSARPVAIVSKAEPMPCEPEVQAEDVVQIRPLQPKKTPMLTGAVCDIMRT